jgi:diacylglycerol kinase (ATP)
VPHRLTPIGATAAALVIANPNARRVRKGDWRKPTERALGRRYGIEIVSTSSADQAAELVRNRMAAEQRPAVVVAAGGDGTVRLVAQELAHTGVPLGVLPLGTGNDFARANGIPDDVPGALDRIVRRSTRAIDLLEVNGRPFVTAGGIGIGAHSALVVPWIKALHPIARVAADSLGSGVYRVAAGMNVMFRPGLAERVRLTWRVP